MNRETKIIFTPTDKHEIEIKTWLTGGEKRKITNAILNRAIFTKQTSNFDDDIISHAQDIALTTIITKIDNSEENILQKILDLRSEDFDFIVNEINKVTENKIDDEVKKK